MFVDPADYDALTFDSYGTLIDWHRGITQGLQPILQGHGIEVGDDALFERYLQYEADVEGGDYQPYRDVLPADWMMRAFCFRTTV